MSTGLEVVGITQLPQNPVVEPVRAFYNSQGDLRTAHVWSSFVTYDSYEYARARVSTQDKSLARTDLAMGHGDSAVISSLTDNLKH